MLVQLLAEVLWADKVVEGAILLFPTEESFIYYGSFNDGLVDRERLDTLSAINFKFTTLLLLIRCVTLNFEYPRQYTPACFRCLNLSQVLHF